MSLSPLSNFTVLIKKIARKSTLRRKTASKKQRSRSYHHTTITTATTTTTTTTLSQDQDLDSVSSCSSNEDEKLHINVPTTKLNDDKVEYLVVSPTSVEDDMKPTTMTITTTDSDLLLSLTTPAHNETQQNDDDDNDDDDDDDNDTTPSILIRDFAYPDASPLHHGKPAAIVPHSDSQISLSSSRFNGCQAKVLYDFTPETDHEIAMTAGQIIWIQYRQCAGWLIADVDDDTGLVPEAYIELL
ncbi:hypothetical protein [Absidia glauca]|uniref:SH3 domain-containing protein n=1 Tax=Absidia glauca TaxID=4829 RepID=A0A168PDV4_ABSGL|nr:hypothetical protein [Absidia glauca]